MEKALELILNELVEQQKQGWATGEDTGWSKGYDAGWARGMEHAIYTLRCAIKDQKKGV
jgi:hypothetical protein